MQNDLWVSQNMTFLSGDGLYFTGGTYTDKGIFTSKFGKINVKSHESLDVPDGVKPGPPIFHNGRLYIKDTLDTLHIFEAE